jgi:Cu-Zn family superoxide dismutase
MPDQKFTTKRKGLLAAVAGAGALAIGAGAVATAGAAESHGVKPPVRKVVVRAALSPAAAAPAAAAVTYNTELAPVGAKVRVEEKTRRDGGTRVELRVRGLVPDRVYGAHVHTKPCGALPADAGPHYQDTPDPVQPSVDPDYANPRNEVWLDLTTTRFGSGRSAAVVDWRFREGGARSVVLHEMATSTHEGHAGTAGARLACVNVPFK